MRWFYIHKQHMSMLVKVTNLQVLPTPSYIYVGVGVNVLDLATPTS